MAFLQENTLIVTTGFGMLEVEPTEICVVQRGIVMQVALKNPGPALSLPSVFGGLNFRALPLAEN